MGSFDFGSDWALIASDGSESAGVAYQEVVEAAGNVDLLVNLGGTLSNSHVIDRVPLRVYVDLDPGFTQLWHTQAGIDVGLDAHDRFATVGQAVGRPGCPVPTCGRHWIPTLPPVVLEHWAPVHASADRWTTVANWRSYGSFSHAGMFYGQKAHSWRGLFGLPAATGQEFEVALAIDHGDDADLAALVANGWSPLDPQVAAGTPWRYREFVRLSRAELSVAKSGYVCSAGAWFSDRSACYLSAGRPVVAQETGFSRFVPTGEGLHAFSTIDEAAEAVARVERDYARHSRAARRLAEDVLDSDKVLGRLLSEVGGAG
jgi:hypothetical protein